MLSNASRSPLSRSQDSGCGNMEFGLVSILNPDPGILSEYSNVPHSRGKHFLGISFWFNSARLQCNEFSPNHDLSIWFKANSRFTHRADPGCNTSPIPGTLFSEKSMILDIFSLDAGRWILNYIWRILVDTTGKILDWARILGIRFLGSSGLDASRSF